MHKSHWYNFLYKFNSTKIPFSYMKASDFEVQVFKINDKILKQFATLKSTKVRKVKTDNDIKQQIHVAIKKLLSRNEIGQLNQELFLLQSWWYPF